MSQSVSVGVVAMAGVVVNVVVGIRSRRCDTASAVSRFAVAFVEFAIGILVLLGFTSPVVGYGLLCLSLVSVFLFDLLREERTRRRRVASLTPRRPADVVPTSWVGIAVLSLLMLAPYVFLDQQRGAALLVGLCAFAMAGIAWRIASAPLQLEGDDIETERVRTRTSRSVKAGLTVVLAIGSIFVFISFVNAGLPAVLPLQRTLLSVSYLMWIVMLAWVALYGRHLRGLSRSES